MSTLTAVILAGGQAKRMKSSVPKVLHRVAGRPMVCYPVRAALEVGADQVLVVVPPNHQPRIAEELDRQFGAGRIQTLVQPVPRGTADAQVAIAEVTSPRVLILCGDTPLLRGEDLQALKTDFEGSAGTSLVMLSCKLADPTGYGRVLRNANGQVTEIREHRDLRTEAERQVDEVNSGVYLGSTEPLRQALSEVRPLNAQGEYYLTDVVAILSRSGAVRAVLGSPDALVGVNDRVQMRDVEELLYRRIIERHARAGVTLHGHPSVDDTVEIGPDAVIEDGVQLRGNTRIGGGATIDVGSVVTDSTLGEGALVKPYCVITSSRVGADAQVGPLAHLDAGSEVMEGAQVGICTSTAR
jgi:bifunctional UDP-N-acetylglucosamine pyrophosphorylase/glucosamine-1-phosphate N-acetyltransferase